MADDVTFQSAALATPPAGTAVAVENIGGKDYQMMKLIIGDDGANDGDVSAANPMPVTVSGSVANSVSTDMEGGGKVAVGTTAVEATFTGTTKSIIISAPLDNTGTLYVGELTVTSDGSNAFAYLEAGESLSIEYDDTDNPVYVVASIAAQNFFKGALL